MSKLKFSKKWFVIAGLLLVATAASFGLYKWTHQGPVTFEGMVSAFKGGLGGDRGCGLDDSCRAVIDDKEIMIDCGFGPMQDFCPAKPIPELRVGTKVRVTAQKGKNNLYNLHCQKCGVTLLK